MSSLKSPAKSFSQLSQKIKAIISQNEYISLSAAILLHGLPCGKSDTIHIFSCRRRRNQFIEGTKIIFLFRKKETIDRLLQFTVDADGARIATPFLAWLDMLDRLKHAPYHQKIAELAQLIPFSRHQLLGTAVEISDAVLKRACFLLGWCCRLNRLHDLSDRFSDSPAYLDTRIPKTTMNWEKNLRLFFPTDYFTLKLREDSARRYNQLFFRNSPAVLSLIEASTPILLAYDRESTEVDNLKFPLSPPDFQGLKRWLEDRRFNEISTDLTSKDIKNIAEWAKDLFSGDERKESILVSVKTAMCDLKNDTQTSQQLLILSIAADLSTLQTLIIESLAVNIWLYGETNLLVLAAASGIGQTVKSKESLSVLTIALIGSGRFNEGLKIFQQAELNSSNFGISLFCRAIVAMRIHNDPQAESLFKRAIECFISNEETDLHAIASIYLGNFHLRFRQYSQASKEYEKVLDYSENLKIPETLLVIMTGNMGIAQFGAGNHSAAVNLLKKALPQCEKTSYSTSYSLFKYYYALNLLMTGKTVEALAEAEETWEIKQRTGNAFLISEIIALAAFINIVMGRSAQINRWQTIIRNTHNLSATEGIFFKIVRKFFQGDFETAEELCKQNEELLYNLASISILKLHAIVMAMIFKLKKNKLKRSQIYKKMFLSGETQSWFHESFYSRTIEALCTSDEKQKEIHLEQLLSLSSSSDRYDLIWFMIVDLLPKKIQNTARDYIHRQFILSSDLVREIAIKYLRKNSIALAGIPTNNDKQKADCLFISNMHIEQISYADFLQRKNLLASNHSFLFDEISGEIYAFPFRVKIKKETQPIKLLSFLLQNLNKTITAAMAYESIWESLFDEEDDLDAFSSTAKRLNSFFKRHSLPAKLKISSSATQRQLSLQLPQHWCAIVALTKNRNEKNESDLSHKSPI